MSIAGDVYGKNMTRKDAETCQKSSAKPQVKFGSSVESKVVGEEPKTTEQINEELHKMQRQEGKK